MVKKGDLKGNLSLENSESQKEKSFCLIIYGLVRVHLYVLSMSAKIDPRRIFNSTSILASSYFHINVGGNNIELIKHPPHVPAGV